jgi:hypothetical protein
MSRLFSHRQSPVHLGVLSTAYILDANLAGVCALQPGDWLGAGPAAHTHTHALVFVLEFAQPALL